MKVFWLISLLFSFAFGIHSQIITGAYTLESTAIDEEKKLQNFLDKEKSFFEANAIIANHKQNNTYYLVTLEPITDELILAAALQKIKIKYKHAYAFKLPQNRANSAVIEPAIPATFTAETPSIDVKLPLHEENVTVVQTPIIEEQNITEITQTQEIVPNKQEPLVEEKLLIKEEIPSKKELQTPIKESSFLDYQTIGLVLLLLTLLVVLLFFLKKSQKKDLQIEVKNTDIIQTNENSFNTLDGLEEGTFNLQLPKEEKQEVGKNFKKRALVAHGKIVKQDFKEFAGSRILIAEDNLINQKVITGLLGESGVEVVVANNGKEALEILTNDKDFTMILMDAHMPIMDGFEATRGIRNNPLFNHIPIVALSGDIADSDIKKMFNAGMNNHLQKPLRIDALYDVLYVYTDAKTDNAQTIHPTLHDNHLNVNNGIATCSGDVDFYHEILDDFSKTYADSDAQIVQFLDAGDFIAADKYLFDLVSISSHIGADALHVAAKELKEALKDKEEKSYFILAEQYSELLRKLLQKIREYK
jgi:CheY-like chemotaxis protein